MAFKPQFDLKAGWKETIRVMIGEKAFSFVNKDAPDNVVAVGVPARVIKKIIQKRD